MLSLKKPLFALLMFACSLVINVRLWADELYLPLPKVYTSSAAGDGFVGEIPFYSVADALLDSDWDKPWMLVFMPVADHNGAFLEEPLTLIAVMAANYNVLYSRITHPDEARQYTESLKEMHVLRGKEFKVKHLILGAHGNPQALTFSEHGLLSLIPKKEAAWAKLLSFWPGNGVPTWEQHTTSLRFLTSVYEAMTKGESKVLLLSCSVGRGRHSIAETIASYLPQIAVIGATRDVPAGSVNLEDLDTLAVSSDAVRFKEFLVHATD